MSIYDYTVTLENGESYSLSKYRGHPMIIVNTATKCGFAPQFKQLEQLYQTYADQGLIILGFPSNQFKQEVSTSQEAAAACRTTYGVSFPMHTIADVNGKDALPLFTYLTKEAPGTLGASIKWNFTKFLVDRDGNVVKRYAPKTNPLKMTDEIESVLQKQVK
ncbi:glutathione peroxidase [Lactiplantibacillus plantarum]|uniref:glutathione peroxidase n=1 Tax=Lactiplantibacillus plantarum TaxID=1590 RepID=UPI00264E3E7F|nr:glutathione peroxidase [Lactiplantibacillus plantarum]MDN7047791.1 glutathione peroxidase [Lactiplantibacillus plantarum]MDN7066182.1 glutathione peroxidase [Lactiplantibacillus plantarum]MDN7072362.1 glutathione peroxidase [Lactiplantibacillus plantarum]WLT36645.1 glutathione peroxidase [Lactiplantibacillus plantarum]